MLLSGSTSTNRKDMSKKPNMDTYCAIRFYGVRPTVTTSTLQSCCKTSRHPLSEGLNSPGLVKGRIESLTGVRSKECQECWIIEDGGGVSRRQLHNTIKFAEEPIYTKETIEVTELAEIDLMTSNTCNVHCIYCSGEYSSRIASDVAKNGPYPGELRNNGESLLPPEEQKKARELIVKMFEDQLGSLKSVLFSGGEPVLDKSFWQLTKKIIDEDKRDLEVRILTNGMFTSKLRDRLLRRIEDLSKYNYVQLNVSIDALDPYQSYIRFGTNSETIINNVKEVRRISPNITINFTPTVTSLNIFVLKEFIEHLDSLNLPGNNKIYPGIVRGPMEVAAMCLPRSVIKTQVEIMDKFIEDNPNSLFKHRDWNTIRATLLNSWGYNESILKTLYAHLVERDRRLGTDRTPIVELFRSHGVKLG